MKGRRGRRRKQLLDDVREKRIYWKLREEELARTLWRTRFGRGYRPVLRQTAELMNYTLKCLEGEFYYRPTLYCPVCLVK
jgi:hypothetical protein